MNNNTKMGKKQLKLNNLINNYKIKYLNRIMNIM